MRIGVDFDNTLAGYDDVFLRLARELGLLPADFTGGKTAVRDLVRSLPDGDTHWQRLQGQAYGARMNEAVFIAGADEFLDQCRREGIEIFIVSHKTRFGHFDDLNIDLRAAATGWMKDKGFFSPEGFAIPEKNLFFEDDRASKVAKIAALSLDWFIDDLPEVLTHPAFPEDVRAIVFGAAAPPDEESSLLSFQSWPEITREVLGNG